MWASPALAVGLRADYDIPLTKKDRLSAGLSYGRIKTTRRGTYFSDRTEYPWSYGGFLLGVQLSYKRRLSEKMYLCLTFTEREYFFTNYVEVVSVSGMVGVGWDIK